MERDAYLVSLSSGLVADKIVNCHRAKEVGMEIMRTLIDNNFRDIVIPRKKRAITLASNAAIKIKDDTITINQQQVFNRIVCILKCKDELESYFKYELAANPPSLFDDVSLRKGKKSSFVKLFHAKNLSVSDIPSHAKYVLDGGHLLHSVIWPRPATFGKILEMYYEHIRRCYGNNVEVIFDGYPNEPTTKTSEQRRRSLKQTSADIVVEKQHIITTSQAAFLANSNNKKNIIKELCKHLRENNIVTRQAVADDDVLIANCAIQSSYVCPVIVVGEDTDLLVLLVALSHDNAQIWFQRPRISDYFSIAEERDWLNDMCTYLLFVYAFTGCDTTSALYRRRKIGAYNILVNDEPMKEKIKIFLNRNAKKEALTAAGESFMLAVYKNETSQSLDDLRFFKYCQAVSRLEIQAAFDLAILPPTKAAAEQHSFRVFHQVQFWMGNYLNPTEWGWKLKNGMLYPISSSLPPVPDEILYLIACSCKKDCLQNCTCKKMDYFALPCVLIVKVSHAEIRRKFPSKNNISAFLI